MSPIRTGWLRAPAQDRIGRTARWPVAIQLIRDWRPPGRPRPVCGLYVRLFGRAWYLYLQPANSPLPLRREPPS
jgi:hypothetical protein